MFFGWAASALAEAMSSVTAQGGSVTAQVNVSTMFGSGRNGILIILAIILGGIGTMFLKDGWWMVSIAMFLFGAALRTGWMGISHQTWGG
jgi:hypothetical protein